MRTLAGMLLLLLTALLLGAASATKKAERPQRPVVTTRLDKTAIWVGDVLRYEIEVTHDRDLEFIPESLQRESFRLAPFVVRDVILAQRDRAPDKKLLALTLLLSSYEISRSELTIPSFNLYYFRRRPGAEGKQTEAETLRIASTRVGLRSTLGRGQNRPRDFKPIDASNPIPGWIAFLLGTAGMVFLFVRGGRWAWDTLHREKPREARVRPRDRRRFVRDGLARMQALRAEGSLDSNDLCQEVSEFLRQYLSQWLKLDADCLTAEEIEAALRKVAIDGVWVQEISGTLKQCDAVRYGRTPLSEEARRRMLETVEKIVTSHKV